MKSIHIIASAISMIFAITMCTAEKPDEKQTPEPTLSLAHTSWTQSYYDITFNLDFFDDKVCYIQSITKDGEAKRSEGKYTIDGNSVRFSYLTATISNASPLYMVDFNFIDAIKDGKALVITLSIVHKIGSPKDMPEGLVGIGFIPKERVF